MGKHQFAPPLPGNREEWERLVARLTPHDPKNR
jgi:hypothetical protein